MWLIVNSILKCRRTVCTAFEQSLRYVLPVRKSANCHDTIRKYQTVCSPKRPFSRSEGCNWLTKSCDSSSHSISSCSFRLVGSGVATGSSFSSVWEAASVVVAFTLRVTSVLWISWSPSITLGRSSGGSGLGMGETTLGEDDADDRGEVRRGLLLAELQKTVQQNVGFLYNQLVVNGIVTQHTFHNRYGSVTDKQLKRFIFGWGSALTHSKRLQFEMIKKSWRNFTSTFINVHINRM